MDTTRFRQELQQKGVTLVAVSKTQPLDRIRQLYDGGQRIFAENRVQDMVARRENLPTDIIWHHIGHLQKNKVKYIAPFVDMIHAVDDAELLFEIEKLAAKNNRTIKCLLQFHIASEETKFGMDLNEAIAMLKNLDQATLLHVQICGVMGMATFTDDQTLIRREFATLKTIFEALKKQFFVGDDGFKEISMGMSGDWEMAVEEGSTMVRIGSLLFQ